MSDTLTDVSATVAEADPAFAWVCECPEAHLGKTCVEYWKNRYMALATAEIQALEQVKHDLARHRYALSSVRQPKAFCAILRVLDVYLENTYEIVAGHASGLRLDLCSAEGEAGNADHL